MAAHDGLQVLAGNELPPHPSAVAQNQTEQPDLADDAGLGGKLHDKFREVDLRLFARRRFKPTLEARRERGANRAKVFLQGCIAALIALALQFPE